VFKYERKRGRDFKGRRVVWTTTTTRKARGRIVDNQDNLAVIGQPVMPALSGLEQNVLDQRSFTLEDILWSIGIWSVLLTMSPVIFVYLLMVA
jgi:hypothetical protein